MTSLFQVIAHEDANDQGKLRQAMALAHQRVEDRFGSFVRKGSVEDQVARYSLVEEDVRAVVAAACSQVGFADVDRVLSSIGKNFVTPEAEPQLRTASVRHEARKPKMCPYHSEVTDISLAAGDPAAGFNAMQSHAWTAQHCQGGDYKGDKCKFKPEMTTQAYWDDRATKLEQKREERAERERIQQEQADALENVTELPEFGPDNDTPAEVETPAAEVVEAEQVAEPVAEAPAEAIPMAMAAKVATETTGLGTTETPINKKKWTPKTVDPDPDPESKYHPTRRKDVTQPIAESQGERWNPTKLNEIGEKTTERQDVTEKGGIDRPGNQGSGVWTEGPKTAVSSLLDEDTVKQAMSKFKRD